MIYEKQSLLVTVKQGDDLQHAAEEMKADMSRQAQDACVCDLAKTSRDSEGDQCVRIVIHHQQERWLPETDKY